MKLYTTPPNTLEEFYEFYESIPTNKWNVDKFHGPLKHCVRGHLRVAFPLHHGQVEERLIKRLAQAWGFEYDSKTHMHLIHTLADINNRPTKKYYFSSPRGRVLAYLEDSIEERDKRIVEAFQSSDGDMPEFEGLF